MSVTAYIIDKYFKKNWQTQHTLSRISEGVVEQFRNFSKADI